LGFLASVALSIWASKPITTALPFAVLKKKKPPSSSSLSIASLSESSPRPGIASLSESSPKPEISTLGC